jgi:hypothetical protein
VRTDVITTLTAAFSGTSRTRKAAVAMQQRDAQTPDMPIPVAEEAR